MFVYRKVNFLFFVSLVYTLIPFFNANNTPYPFVTIAATILFVVSYLGSLYSNRQWLSNVFWIYILGYTLIMSVVNIYMAMFINYAINLFTWHYSERLLSKRALSLWASCIILLIMVVLSSAHIINKIVVIVVMVFAVAMVVAVNQSMKSEALKQELYEKNQSINLLLAENERNRIGRDLHDTLGHVFAMLSVKSELTLALLEKENIKQAKKEVIDIQSTTKEAMKNVRELINALTKHSLDDELAILHNMLSMANVKLTVNKNTAYISDDLQHHLAMILRELANNLLKHSQATRCELSIQQNNLQIIMVMQDNGVGFSTLVGNELKNIKDRLTIIKGTVIISSLHHPTEIKITIPLEDNA